MFPQMPESKYGWAHQRRRASWAKLMTTQLVLCSRCRQPVTPLQEWDLDHAADGGYLGPAHSACNRASSRHRVEAQGRRWA
jgi:hypothetical protein